MLTTQQGTFETNETRLIQPREEHLWLRFAFLVNSVGASKTNCTIFLYPPVPEEL